MFAQVAKTALKQLTNNSHSKRIIIFSSQVASVIDDNTSGSAYKVLGESYTSQAVKRLAMANISPFFIVINPNATMLAKQRKNFDRLKCLMQ